MQINHLKRFTHRYSMFPGPALALRRLLKKLLYATFRDDKLSLMPNN